MQGQCRRSESRTVPISHSHSTPHKTITATAAVHCTDGLNDKKEKKEVVGRLDYRCTCNQSGSRRSSHPLLFLAPHIRRPSTFVESWHNEPFQNRALGCPDLQLSFFPFVSAVPTYMFQEHSSPAHYIYSNLLSAGLQWPAGCRDVDKHKPAPLLAPGIWCMRGKDPGCWCYRGYSLS